MFDAQALLTWGLGSMVGPALHDLGVCVDLACTVELTQEQGSLLKCSTAHVISERVLAGWKGAPEQRRCRWKPVYAHRSASTPVRERCAEGWGACLSNCAFTASWAVVSSLFNSSTDAKACRTLLRALVPHNRCGIFFSTVLRNIVMQVLVRTLLSVWRQPRSPRIPLPIGVSRTHQALLLHRQLMRQLQTFRSWSVTLTRRATMWGCALGAVALPARASSTVTPCGRLDACVLG